MTNHESFLHGIQIATPCNVSWDSMTGDERTRHCQSCQLSVYNIASMSTAEAEQLILQNEGRLCVRIFRRKDGTVITKDCPNGLRAIRDRYYRGVAAVAGLVAIASVSVVNLLNNGQFCRLQKYAVKLNNKAEAVQIKYAPSGVAGGMSPFQPEVAAKCSMKGQMAPMTGSVALKKFDAVKKGIKHD